MIQHFSFGLVVGAAVALLVFVPLLLIDAEPLRSCGVIAVVFGVALHGMREHRRLTH